MSNQNEGVYVWNNVVYSIDDTVGSFVAYNPGGYAWVHNNLFWDGGAFRAYWVNVKTSLTGWQAADPTHVYNNIEADPLLSNTVTTYPDRDYSLRTGSVATAAGASAAADGTDPFALFLSRYGVSIAEDVAGRTRVAPYSAGAYQ